MKTIKTAKIITRMAVATTIAIITLVSTASAFSGNAGLLVGGKLMNSKDWENVDIHNSIGFYTEKQVVMI